MMLQQIAAKTHSNFQKLSNFLQEFFASGKESLQGCQMVYFQTKNPNLAKYWRALEWKMLVYFMTIWCNFMVIWYKL
jgi:hypothetical protein